MDVRRIKDYLTRRSVSIASILEMNKLRWWQINEKCKEKYVRKTGMEAKALVSAVALYGKTSGFSVFLEGATMCSSLLFILIARMPSL